MAVLAILLNHAGLPWLPGGYLGVDIFFVISGFVITRILVAELQDGSFSLLAFWRRRARRIIPALAVLLATVLSLAWFLLSPAQIEQFWPVFLGSVAFAPNIVLWIDVGYFSPEAETEPLLHLWSLGVEEQFYLVYPLILLWLWRVGPAKLRPALIGLAVASLVLAGVLAPLATRAGYYLFPPHAWELLAGGLAALSAWQPVQRRQIYIVLGSVLILLPLLTFRDSAAGLPTVLPIAGTVLCILVAGPDTWLGRGLASRPAVDVPGASGWPVALYGDSHAADFGSVLRVSGRNPMQITA